MSRTIDDASLRDAVARRQPLIRQTVGYVHAHPELAHEEVRCSAYLQAELAKLGLRIESGLAGLDTAFRAVLKGGQPGPTVALTALYDAVPSVPPEGGILAVHSCGHGPIAGGVVGAIAALAAHREELAGDVVVMGCPADEIHAPETVRRGGGKLITAGAGAWDGVDAALYAHPEPIDTAWTASMWMRRDRVHVSATRDLAAGASQPVLDAVVTAVAAVRALPAGSAVLEHLEMDGDVESGGGMVATATVLLWATDEAGVDELGTRLRSQLEGTWTAGVPVPSIAPDERVRAAVGDAIEACGRSYVDDPPALPFATDFGAVTRVVPAALVGVGRPEGWAFHTPDGEAQFASEAGIVSAVGMAEVLALAVARLSDAS